MSTVLLSTSYFGPVQWYQKLNRFDDVLIEQHEHFLKQTYRNRCLIATTQGTQALSLPVEAAEEGHGRRAPARQQYHPEKSQVNGIDGKAAE